MKHNQLLTSLQSGNSKSQISLKLLLGGVFMLCQQFSFAQATTFVYTGTAQTYTVPPCVFYISVDVRGAQGAGTTGQATFPGGLGGRVQATLAVTPGEVLEIQIGGQPSGSAAGYNGGGLGGPAAGGGGGASDIRQGGTGLSNRTVVAAGGGGAGLCSTCSGNTTGGAGGGTTGGHGYYTTNTHAAIESGEFRNL